MRGQQQIICVIQITGSLGTLSQLQLSTTGEDSPTNLRRLRLSLLETLQVNSLTPPGIYQKSHKSPTANFFKLEENHQDL